MSREEEAEELKRRKVAKMERNRGDRERERQGDEREGERGTIF